MSLASVLASMPVSVLSPTEEMVNPRVSYTLDESLPYSKKQRARIMQEVLGEMLVREGPKTRVSMLPHDEFLAKAGEYDEIPQSAAAFFDGKDIYFSDYYWHKRNPDHFSRMLQHELGHALGLDHSKGESIMNESVSVWHKVSDKDKERIKALRGY